MTPQQRLVLVAGLVLVVAVVVYVLRRRPLSRSRRIDAADLSPGVYLLTSDDCDTCARARARLETRGVHYTELSWQRDPAGFERLGVDAVPSTLVVADDGSARWWRGGVPPSRQIP